MPFKVYRSSAGSGKTYTLVKEYLRIALGSTKPDSYRGILAVTFTNKAAEEMKSRVLSALQSMSQSSEENTSMAQTLLVEIGITEDELQSRSANVLKHMLHHYSDVGISTIDKFSHKLIRTFAQDLGLSVNFEVELDADVLKQAVLDELMNQVGSDQILTHALTDLIESAIDDEKGWNVDEKIKTFIGVLFSEESRFHLEHLQKIELKEFSELRQKLRQKLELSKAELREIGADFIKNCKSNYLVAKDFSYGDRGIYNFFSKLQRGTYDLPSNTILKNVENDKWYGGKATHEQKAAIDSIKTIANNHFNRTLELIPMVKYHQVVFNAIYGVALLDEMNRILTQIQAEDEVLHIGEFNHLISDVVMKQSAPFIYERIGARYKHFLVDEFQDTSILQWFNLLPLIDESLASDNLCLVVGDAKQSIYRWRGGDVQQFIELPKIHKPKYVQERISENEGLPQLFDDRALALDRAQDIKNLDSNFRSKSTVIEFNNNVFTALQPHMPEQFRNMYDGGAQQSNSTEKGLVCVKMWRQVGAEYSWPEYDQLMQDQLKLWIEECKDDGYKEKDIALIFSTNKDAIRTALFLIESGYNVVSNESLLINGSVKVRFMVNVAVFLNEPTNTTNVAELLEHLALVTNTFPDLSEMLMNSKGGTDTNFIWAQLKSHYPEVTWEKLSQETPYNLFSILAFGLFPEASEPHISFFLNEVLEFTQSKRKSLADFIKHWIEKRSKLSIALEENGDAINLITIHKSKGLEFPVVMHPYADYPTRTGKNSLWAYVNDPELKPLDRIRLSSTSSLMNTPFEADHELESSLEKMDMYNQLYVALTRAEDRLYVAGKLKRKEGEDKNPSSAIQHIRKYLLDESLIDSADFEYTSGSRIKTVSTLKEHTNLELKKTGNPFWQQRVSIAKPKVVMEETGDTSNPRLRGIAVHEALASIKTDLDIDKAVKSLVEEGLISENEMANLTSHIQNLVTRSDLKHLFSAEKRIRNEADIQLENGKWLRPDRVVTHETSAWVIDYKTGEVRKEHEAQVEEYKKAVAHLGYEKVVGLLLYLDSEKVVYV